MIKKYVLFGTRGSYHHQVAMAVFGEIDSSGLIFVDTFEKVVEHVGKGAYSVLATKNSTIGVVAQNHKLLEKNLDKLEIIEYFDLPIQHCLVGLKNSNLDAIKIVYSHPAALGQCKNWLAKNLPQATLQLASDTAAAVEKVVSAKDPTLAAISSSFAAEIHGAFILADNCSDLEKNTTSFAVLKPKLLERKK